MTAWSSLKFTLLILAINVLYSASGIGASPSHQCARLMAEISATSQSGSEAYSNLFKALVRNKNSIGTHEIYVLMDQANPVNPFDVITIDMNAEERFAFRSAFEKVLTRSDINPTEWERIKNELGKLAEEKKSSQDNRDDAKEKTAAIFAPVPLNKTETVSAVDYDDGFQSATNSVFVFKDSKLGAPYTLNAFSIEEVGGEVKRYFDANTGARYFRFASKSGKIFIMSINRGGREVKVVELHRRSSPVFIGPLSEMFHSSTPNIENIKLFMFENSKGEQELVGVLYNPQGASLIETFRKNLSTEEKAWQPLPMGFFEIQQLSGDRIVAVLAGRRPPDNEIIVKEIGGSRRGIFKAVKPSDLGEYPRSKVLETKSGRSYLATIDKSVGYVFDMATGESMRLTVGFDSSPEFEIFKEGLNNELVIVAKDHSKTELIHVDFDERKSQERSIGFHKKIEYLSAKDGKDVLLFTDPSDNSSQNLLSIVDFNNGQYLGTFNLGPFNLGRYLFSAEQDDGRIISYFIRGNTLVPLQIFGPLPDKVTKP